MSALTELSLTAFQWTMVGCTLVAMALAVAFIRRLPDSPQARRLKIRLVVIVVAIFTIFVLEKLGWLR